MRTTQKTSISNFKSLSSGKHARNSGKRRPSGYIYLYKQKNSPKTTSIRVILKDELTNKARLQEGDEVKLGYDETANSFIVSPVTNNEPGSRLHPVGKEHRLAFNFTVDNKIGEFFQTFTNGNDRVIEPKEIEADRNAVYFVMT